MPKKLSWVSLPQSDKIEAAAITTARASSILRVHHYKKAPWWMSPSKLYSIGCMMNFVTLLGYSRGLQTPPPNVRFPLVLERPSGQAKKRVGLDQGLYPHAVEWRVPWPLLRRRRHIITESLL